MKDFKTILGMIFMLGIIFQYPANAATVVMIPFDAHNEGFHDQAPRSPVGGNNGTTLGQQRTIAFQAAADLVANKVKSGVTIYVDVSFDPLFCDTATGLFSFGRASPHTSDSGFPNAPRNDVFYPQALANALAGYDRWLNKSDIFANFNSSLDNGCINNISWYYGLDGSPPQGQFDFVGLVTHELMHGFGFLSGIHIVDAFDNNGNQTANAGDARGGELAGPWIYDAFIKDLDLNKTWDKMTPAERKNSITNTNRVVWDGPVTTTNGASTLSAGTVADASDSKKPKIKLFSPNPAIQGSSIVHWDPSVAPDPLMEHAYTNYSTVNRQLGLSACVLADIGWLLENGVSCPDLPLPASTLASTPTTHDFGGVVVGESKSHIFLLTNAGNSEIKIGDATIPAGVPFSIDPNNNGCNGVTLTPGGGGCVVTATFTPSDTTQQSSTITVSSDAANNPYIIPIQGLGIPEPAPVIAATPATHDFSEVDLGGNSIQVITLTNTGNADLEIGQIAVSGSGFSTQDDMCSNKTVTADKVCTLTVRFAPTAAGAATGTISAPSNAAQNEPLDISLSGIGLEDSDGIPATLESQVPNGSACSPGTGDGNCDGMSDAEQKNVASFTDINGNYVTLVTNTGTLESVQTMDNPDQASTPVGATFHHGFFSFKVNCNGVCPNPTQVILILSDNNPPNAYYKYGPSATSPVHRFYPFSGANINGNIITLNLVDGGSGDSDLTVDNMITDPGAPASSTATLVGSGGGGGGGCSLSSRKSPVDPAFPLLILLSLLILSIRIKSR